MFYKMSTWIYQPTNGIDIESEEVKGRMILIDADSKYDAEQDLKEYFSDNWRKILASEEINEFILLNDAFTILPFEEEEQNNDTE